MCNHWNKLGPVEIISQPFLHGSIFKVPSSPFFKAFSLQRSECLKKEEVEAAIEGQPEACQVQTKPD